MVKSGSFKVSPGSFAGRIGTNLGESLAETVPKEVEQYRLRKGLENFQKNASEQTPSQQFTSLLSIPGIGKLPQAIQQFPEILKQEQLGKALLKQGQESNQPPQFPNYPGSENNQPSTGLTTRPGQEALRKGFIPPTQQQILSEAGQEYNKNPGLFKNNPENAISFVEKKYAQEQAINQAYQQQRQGEQALQRNVQQNLSNQASTLGAKVPGEVYSEIEQKAIKSVLPKSEGGEGLTDEEAKVKYGEELNRVSRQYNALRAIGNWTLPSQKPTDIRRSLNTLQREFKERGDLRNFRDSMIAENGLSPEKASYLAYPISDQPSLEKILNKLPDVKTKVSTKKGFIESFPTDYSPEAILSQMSPVLAKEMGKEGSPLSIATALESKGYDPSYFLNYLNENKDKLELNPRQIDDLSKPRNFLPTLGDFWLFSLTNQDSLVN